MTNHTNKLMIRHLKRFGLDIDIKVLLGFGKEIWSNGMLTSAQHGMQGLTLICLRYVDGHDYFYAASELLESAKECIFIQDWWQVI